MLLERFKDYDLVPGDNGGFALVKRDTPPWSGVMIMFTKNPDGSYKFSCAIEEQGVPSVCYSTGRAMAHLLYSMQHALDLQTHSEVRGQKQGAD